MTKEELHKILDDDSKKISLSEFREIIFEMIDDCTREASGYSLQYYQGEINEFYLALDLSEHIK